MNLPVGIEKEVFITQPLKPALSSLFYLLKLLMRDPLFYYTHTASNFARGKDVRFSLMSGVEVSTGIHSSAEEAIKDLALRRKDLIEVCPGYIVPMGHLINCDTPTNTCALQIHLKADEHVERIYDNLAYFLPL